MLGYKFRHCMIMQQWLLWIQLRMIMLKCFCQSQSQGSITLKIIPAVVEDDKLKESRVRTLCLNEQPVCFRKSQQQSFKLLKTILISKRMQFNTHVTAKGWKISVSIRAGLISPRVNYKMHEFINIIYNILTFHVTQTHIDNEDLY